MPTQVYPLNFSPGINRDSTQFSGDNYTDGLWCRWQFGRPRKMLGYRTITQSLSHISRALDTQTQNAYTYVHSGHSNGIEVIQVDSNGIGTTPNDRTPGGFAVNANNIWQIGSYYDTTSNLQQVIAFVVPGLMDIAYGTTGALYAGPVYTTAALTPVSGLATDATGGIVVLPPYLVVYGSNGLVQWSVAGKPLDLVNTGSGAARITAQKVVRGFPIRGGGSYSPGAVLWSLDSVIRMYFVGSPTVFAFDTISDQSSIVSHNAVAEADGTYYWAGTDRFLMFNGVVREIPNNMNINYFFDNLNRAYAQKVFAVKNARYGEIWWCFPLVGSTEPNAAVIYNYRENSWYDTMLPNSGRSAAADSISSGMVMSGVDPTYRLWQHETGYDQVDGGTASAIDSYFTTGIIAPESFKQPVDMNLHIDTLEPDFVQAGNMTITPYFRGAARGVFNAGTPVSFAATPATAFDQQVPIKTSGRQIKFKFESNVQGGDYRVGRILANVSIEQARRTM